MKKILLLLLIAGLFSQEEKRSGFGFTFDGGNTIMNLLSGSVLSGGSTISLTPTLYLIDNLPFCMVEPSISYYYKKSTETEIWTGKKTKEANSVTILGLGFLENKLKQEKYNTYWGFRFAVGMDSETSSDDNIYLFAPVYGAEYDFSKNFSLGGETRLNYAFDTSDEKTSIIDFSTHLFFRFYK